MTDFSAHVPAMALAAALAIGSALAMPDVSHAAPAYPGSAPVRLIVAYSPGGTTDFAGRKIAQALSQETHGSFVVDNRPGASGQIGTVDVVRAAPDGHTLLVMDTTYSMLPSMYPKLAFDQANDLVPISTIADTPVILAVNKDSPYKTLKDLIDKAKATPDKVTYGSGGVGSATDLAVRLFEQQAHVQLSHIPYKGASEAAVGVMANNVELVISPGPTILPQVRSGKLRALAVSSPHRLKALPDVPTFAESGYPKYEVAHWFGLAAPKGTPQAIINDLQKLVQEATRDPAFAASLDDLGVLPGGLSSGQFKQRIVDDTKRWGAISAQIHEDKK